MRRSRGKRLIWFGLLLLGAASVCGVGQRLHLRFEAQRRMEALQMRVSTPVAIIPIVLADTGEPIVSADHAAVAPMGEAMPAPEETEHLENLRMLREENGDFAGWLTLPGTILDYPVMQSVDRPWHYLDHDFANKSSRSGLPFIEESCDLSGDRKNLIIYGHNMKDGSMFGALHKLCDAEFYENNRVLTFDTPERTGQYRIFSVFYMTVGDEGTFQFYRYPNPSDAEEHTAYAARVQACSIYPKDTEIGMDAELLTLVTCVRHAKNKRLVVVAVRVK